MTLHCYPPRRSFRPRPRLGVTHPGNSAECLAASDWSSIRAAYEAGRHADHRQENGPLTARNPGQQWRTEFDGKGFTVTLAYDTTPNYENTALYPATPTKWTYRAIYRVDDHQVGQ